MAFCCICPQFQGSMFLLLTNNLCYVCIYFSKFWILFMVHTLYAVRILSKEFSSYIEHIMQSCISCFSTTKYTSLHLTSFQRLLHTKSTKHKVLTPQKWINTFSIEIILSNIILIFSRCFELINVLSCSFKNTMLWLFIFRSTL